MIFGRSGDPAYTVPEFAAHRADLLVPIDADIAVIMPWLRGTVNSSTVQTTTPTCPAAWTGAEGACL
jgi:hypothetical protein